MKALVLAGGRGKRLGPITDERNKSMYLFRGRALIEYSLSNAIKSGVSEIVIVVGYKAEQIINRFGNSYEGTRISYVIQWDAKGVVDAIECSRSAIGDDDFMLFLADEVILKPRHEAMLETFRSENLFCLCGVVPVNDLERIKATYSVIFDETSKRIFRLIEKPRNPLSAVMGTGNCVFNREIFNYIATTPINQSRGEKELPDLIQGAIDDGRLVKLMDVGGEYVNVNTAADIVSLEAPTFGLVSECA